jgi:hypothetical protein
MFMERREAKRINALDRDEDLVLIKYGAQHAAATIVNMSTAGTLLALIDSGTKFPPGDPLSLFFDNGGRLFKVSAAAVRTINGHVGLRFCDLTPEEEREIRSKVARLEVISDKTS